MKKIIGKSKYSCEWNIKIIEGGLSSSLINSRSSVQINLHICYPSSELDLKEGRMFLLVKFVSSEGYWSLQMFLIKKR